MQHKSRKPFLFILKSPLPMGRVLPVDLLQLWCTHSSQWLGLAWRLLKQPRWQLCIRTCPIALAWSLGSPDTLPHLRILCLAGQKNTDDGFVSHSDLGTVLLNCYEGTIATGILQITVMSDFKVISGAISARDYHFTKLWKTWALKLWKEALKWYQSVVSHRLSRPSSKIATTWNQCNGWDPGEVSLADGLVQGLAGSSHVVVYCQHPFLHCETVKNVFLSLRATTTLKCHWSDRATVKTRPTWEKQSVIWSAETNNHHESLICCTYQMTDLSCAASLTLFWKWWLECQG